MEKTAIEYFKKGEFPQALNIFKMLAEISPSINYLMNIGVCYYKMMDYNNALRYFRKSYEIEKNAYILFNIGKVYSQLGDFSNALFFLKKLENSSKYYSQSIDEQIRIELELGNIKRIESLINIYSKICNDINKVDFYRAQLFERQFENNKSIEKYKRLIENNYETEKALSALGRIYLNQGEINKSKTYYKKSHLYKRDIFSLELKEKQLISIRPAKIEHDIEQLSYLKENNIINEKHLKDYKEELKIVLSENDLNKKNNWKDFNLDVNDKKEIKSCFNQPYFIHNSETKKVFLNRNISNLEKLNNENISHIIIDDFLNSEAIHNLYDELVMSAFWYDYKYENGYLGAFVEDGFASELILKIGYLLKESICKYYKRLNLTRIWAFKYDSNLSGIAPHADYSELTVNLWITPDKCNLNLESGGLKIYDKQSEKEWGFNKYNGMTESSLKKILNQSLNSTIYHKRNRALIFKSRYFHETDNIDFASGYDQKRINISFLFGYNN